MARTEYPVQIISKPKSLPHNYWATITKTTIQTQYYYLRTITKATIQLPTWARVAITSYWSGYQLPANNWTLGEPGDVFKAFSDRTGHIFCSLAKITWPFAETIVLTVKKLSHFAKSWRKGKYSSSSDNWQGDVLGRRERKVKKISLYWLDSRGSTSYKDGLEGLGRLRFLRLIRMDYPRVKVNLWITGLHE